MKTLKKDWKPTASLQNLRARAEILGRIRAFFSERGVLEVETPLLSHYTNTDPHIASFEVKYQGKPLYLQTSPEFAIKRLLAAGIGDCYQICKAFRDDEAGRMHNPEFTMLEWYRVGFTHHDLINEIDEFLQAVLQTKTAERASYAEIFKRFLGVDPHTSTASELQNCAKFNGVDGVVGMDADNRDDWLNLLMSHCIEPYLGIESPIAVYNYPETQAALARIRRDGAGPTVAERFEFYFKGIELANGFHELLDAQEQRERFVNDLAQRKRSNQPIHEIDERFLAALEHGLPACAGVALGVDRLVMLATQSSALAEVLGFPVDVA